MSAIVSPRHHEDGNGILRHMRGMHPDRPVPPSHKRFMLVPPGTTFPVKFFWSPMTQVRVRDQGQEGCCVGETYAELIDALHAKAGKLTPATETSEQDAYKVARANAGTPLTEDSGTTGADMTAAASAVGVTTEALCPFSDQETSYSAERTPEQIADAATRKLELDLMCPTLEQIKFSLTQGFGLMSGFTCFPGIMTSHAAQTGEIPLPTAGQNNIGGHEMGTVGWDDDYVIPGASPGVLVLRQHWNLWGATFEGVQSYGLMPYDAINQGIIGDFRSIRLVEMPS